MDAGAADVQFGMLVMLIGYGVYLNLRSGKTSSRTEIFEEDSGGITSVEFPQTEMGSNGEPEPEGLKVKVALMASCHSFHLNLSMVRWMYSRCTRREELAA